MQAVGLSLKPGRETSARFFCELSIESFLTPRERPVFPG